MMSEHRECISDMDIRAQEIAKEIIRTSQSMLLVRMRFLDVAIFQLQPEEVDFEALQTVATDGEKFYYNADYVLKQYVQDQHCMTRKIMHSLLHCIFIHPFIGSQIDRHYWDFAADVAVEVIMEDIGFEYEKQFCSQRESILNELTDELPSITAERVYHYCRRANFSERQIEEMRAPFLEDEHECWYDRDNQNSMSGSGQSGEESRDSDEGVGNGELSAGSGYADASSLLKGKWQKISKSMQVDLDSVSKGQGYAPGSMSQALNELHRERYDYSGFLKKFAVLGEAMKINDDEFDYIFYTYGLKLYGNVPLIEPLEYKEVKRIKEFVIAIDTSGSTSGELVQKFLQKTYNILKNEESFFTKINVHIIQCDAEIQEAVKITSDEEFESYLKGLSIKGLGGTDFRPVFTYVDQLIKNGELTNLKGMIYFTDGFGTFPENKPDYETAFVFIKDGYWNPEVPSWAIKLVLEENEVLENEY